VIKGENETIYNYFQLRSRHYFEHKYFSVDDIDESLVHYNITILKTF